MEPLSADEIRRAVQAALAEDVGAGDVTTLATVPAAARARAVDDRARTARRRGSGLRARPPFAKLSPAVRCRTSGAADGERIGEDVVLLRVSGPARAILTAERVALNFVQRLSGIATLTAQFVDAVEGTRAQILDTRKTTPGWRRFEKYAVALRRRAQSSLRPVRHGPDQGQPPRRACATRSPIPIAAAVAARARDSIRKLKVEVEADTLEQVEQAVDAGADIILLDNMTPDQLRAAVQLVGGPREDRGQRRRELCQRPRHRRNRRGLHLASARSPTPRARWTSAWTSSCS